MCKDANYNFHIESGEKSAYIFICVKILTFTNRKAVSLTSISLTYAHTAYNHCQ